MPILLGVVVLVLLLWAGKSFSKADPKQAAKLLRTLGGGAALLFATFLLFRGEIGPAITVGAIGLGALGWLSLMAGGLRRPHAEKFGSDFAGAYRICRDGARSR